MSNFEPYIFANNIVINAISIQEFFVRARRVHDFDSLLNFYLSLPTFLQIAFGIGVFGLVGISLTFIIAAFTDNHKTDF